jgi:serine/threonine protein kinase/Tfp pilus assembly protein PilF
MSSQSGLLIRTGTNPDLDDLLEQLGNRLQAGERLDLEAVVMEYPRHADDLRRYFPALRILTGLKHTSQEPAALGELGDFRILREVGKGGMGVVYEAEQVSLGRRVALKVLPFAATMDARQLQRFQNEARAAACLHHTNIVPVFSVGCEHGVHFYAMQYIDGRPLSELIRQMREREKKAPKTARGEPTAVYETPVDDAASTPLPAADMTLLTGEGRRGRDYFRKVAELGAQAAEALDHAHQLGIVHRDIKPANLLVDGRGIVWVTDFGLAHVQHGEASLTMTGQAVGTPRYMSPEQALAKRVPIDHRTDVYSLGVTLYELLTLRPAFASDDRQELLRLIAFDDPSRPQRLERSIPAELEIIILKAMEKRPQDRYATAKELADDLRRFLENKPIQARRPWAWERLAKWMRRHKSVMRAVAATLVIGTVVSVWQAVEANTARKLAAERLENERQARHDAEAHFQMALNAVRLMLFEVGDQRLTAIPQMKETRQRLLDEALAFYTDLIASNPRNSQAYLERGELYRRMRKPEQARDDFQKAVEYDLDNAEALGQLGNILSEMEEKDEIVLPYLRGAMELQPRYWKSYLRLFWHYERTKRRKKELAAARWKIAEFFPPGSAEAYLYLGEACLFDGDPRTAREHFEKCLSIVPSEYHTHSYAYLHLGRIQSALGEYDQALAAYSKALDSPRIDSETLAIIYQDRGDMYLDHKNYAAALSEFNSVIELHPAQHLYKRRGFAHFHLQHYEQALADIAKAVELPPYGMVNLIWGITFEDLFSCPDEKFRTGILALADKTIKMLESKPDNSQFSTADYGIRAALHVAFGKFDQAECLARDFLERVRKKDESKSADNAGALAVLGYMLLKQQKDTAAEPFLRECLAIREQKMPDEWGRYNTVSVLGGALLGQKKYAEAEPLLLQGYEGMKQRESQNPRWVRIRLAEAGERLVRFYEVTNQPEKAKQWRGKLAEGKKASGPLKRP